MVETTDTQTASASDSFGGLDVTLTSTLPNFATDSFQADIDITTDGVSPKINFALVIDTSGSTRNDSGSDVDGDMVTDTFLKAQQFAAKAFFQNLVDAGYPPADVTITLVEYNSTNPTRFIGDFDLDDQTAFDSEIDGLNSGGGTNFEQGLNEVIDRWNARNGDSNPDNDVDENTTNSVVFLSDGTRNGGDNAADEAAELLNQFDARITAIGVGQNSNLNDLNVIDTTPGGGMSAQKVEDVADLADIINAPPPLPELESVQIIVDGNVLETIPVGDPRLVSTALGFRISCVDVDGYPYVIGEDLDVEITATFNDGSDVLTLGNILIPQTICFVTGTRILTPDGPVAVEDLVDGDRIITRDNGVQRITWVGASRVTPAMMQRHPELRPIRIMPNAFGPQMPSRNVYVSRQHKILVRDWRAEMAAGSAAGVLVPAGALVDDKKITVDHACKNGATYYHVACEAHEVIYADGLECESFHPSARNIAGMSDDARAEFLALFPDLASDGDARPAARTTLPMQAARALAG